MEWTGKWITGPAQVDDDEKVPPYLFRKKIEIKREKEIARATLYASALGVYTFRINGNRVGDRYFAPGYTEYFYRVQYQEYPVTEMLKEMSGSQTGDREAGAGTTEGNAGETDGTCAISLTAELTGGWYAGRVGLAVRGNQYGPKRALLAQLLIEYADGTKEIIGTDTSWQVTTDGPRRKACFFDGEIYDARQADPNAATYTPARLYEGELPEQVVPDVGVPVKVHEKVKPKRIWKNAAGETLVDFGRNMAGILEIGPIDGKAGQRIVIRHGELVQNDELYTGNLRTAKQTLDYTCRDGIQTYRPEFTYMGFQYVAVTGMEVTEENLAAWDIYSDMEQIGDFSCSDERLNQFQKNIQTSLKANFVDIPTDCPQRDERCGWTGDIALFAPTAAFNMDIAGFMNKWLGDLALVQEAVGVVPSIVPSNGFIRDRKSNFWAKIYDKDDAVWGDAAVLVTWAVFQSNGDVSLLDRQYDSMKAWVEYERTMAEKGALGNRYKKYIWNRGFHLGDWLAPGENVAQWMVKAKWTSTAYFANSARILSRAAEILGKEEDAKAYEDLYQKIREAFIHCFVGKDGHIKKGFQSVYVLALQFGLLEKEQEKLALEDLVSDIRSRGNHLATGFVGTDKLPFALSDHGRADVAYDLLMQETCPSWLYPVLCGATSTWERWDALKPDGTINNADDGTVDMVSFNHYAYGAVGNWLYTRVGGLQMTEPGYRKFQLAPIPGGGLTWAKVSHICPYGKIESRWEIRDGKLVMDFTVPENTSADVCLPDGTRSTYEPGSYSVECAYEGK